MLIGSPRISIPTNFLLIPSCLIFLSASLPTKSADFVGKDALKKIKQEGIKRKLVGIEILGDPISKVVPPQYTPGYFVPDHWPVFDDKKEIGYVTSKCFSPRLKKNIGYAFIPIDYTKNDTEFEIRSPYANLKAKVVPLPFFDPKKKIPIK